MTTPVEIGPKALDELRGAEPALRPAILEQLNRIAADFRSCSRLCAFPRPHGWESGIWCRWPGDEVSLVEVIFDLHFEPTRIVVRRVLIRNLDRIPDWVLRPSEYGNDTPWPIVTL